MNAFCAQCQTQMGNGDCPNCRYVAKHLEAEVDPTMPPEMPERVGAHMDHLWRTKPGRSMSWPEVYAAIRDALMREGGSD